MTKEEAIKHLETYSTTNGSGQTTQAQHEEAKRMAIKALEQEPCEDAVSRQAVLDELETCFDTYSIYDENNGENYIIYEDAVDMMEKLQPVTPTRKVGKWIFAKTIFDKYGCTVECPSCHKKWKTYDEIRWEKENKFCPNCGTDMRGGEQ